MATVPLVKLAQVNGQEEPDVDLAQAQGIAEAELERLCNRKFKHEEIEGEWHTVVFGRVFPKVLPLQSVQAVEDINGQPVKAIVSGDSILCEVPRDGAEVRVDYTGGYAEKADKSEHEVPEDLRAVAQGLADWHNITAKHHSLHAGEGMLTLPGPRSQQKIVRGIPALLYRRLDPFKRRVPAVGGSNAV